MPSFHPSPRRSLMAALGLLFAALLAAAPPLSAQRQARTPTERQGAESYNQAAKAFGSGNYQASIPLFLAADSLIGTTGLVDRTKLRYALGVAYQKTNQPARALAQFEWVAGQRPDYPLIQFQAAESAREAKQRAKALQYYRQALPTVSGEQQALLHSRIGELQSELGQLEQALASYDRAIAITPAAGYRLLRGRLYDRQAERLDHAQDENYDFEGAIRSGELTEEAINRAGELRRKALEDYQAAAAGPQYAAAAGKLLERSRAILDNNRSVMAEIRYYKENNE